MGVRALTVGLAGAAVAAALPASASAPTAAPAQTVLSYRLSMSPGTIRVPGTKRLAYRLELVTGAREQRFFIAFEIPGLAPGVIEPAGSPITLGKPRVEGPGRLAGLAHNIAEFAPLTCLRGYVPSGLAGASVVLPANTRSTLVVPARMGRFRPWHATDLRLAFRFKGRRPIRPPRPRVVGRRRARLTLRTRPRTKPTFRGTTVFRPGQHLRIHGRLDPPLRNRRVDLRFGHTTEPVTHALPRASNLIARVRTDSRGRFAYDWSFRTEGVYSLVASYPRQPGALVPDRSCPRAFTIDAD